MEIQDLKDGILETLDSIDRDRLSLLDLKTYAEVLKIVSDTQTEGQKEFWAKAIETISKPIPQFNYPTISDMKGEITNV